MKIISPRSGTHSVDLRVIEPGDDHLGVAQVAPHEQQVARWQLLDEAGDR